MSDHIKQAARDAIEFEGELVTYTDDPDIQEDIWVKIRHNTALMDGEGTPMGRVTLLRGMKDDMPALTNAGLFTRESGEVWQKKKLIEDDGITVAFEIGKKVSA